MKRNRLIEYYCNYVILSIVIITLLCPAIVSADVPKTKRLAILSSQEIQKSGLADLLTVQLQELPNVELVEREILQKIFDEVAFSRMFGAEQTGNRRKVGALLKADVLVLLSMEEQETEGITKRNIKIVISDCSNGARLRMGWVLFNESNLEEISADIAKTANETLIRFKDGVKQIIGVPHFMSKNLVHDYDHLQASYAFLLQNALSLSDGVAVIEIEEAQAIRRESELAGDMTGERIVPLFIEGEFKVQDAISKNQSKVDLALRISDNTGVIKKIERSDINMDEIAAFISEQVAVEILKLSKLPYVKTFDEEKQFAALVNRASEFAKIGAWEHSIGLREAAVLLKPDSAEQRIKIIEENYRMPAQKYQSSWKPVEYKNWQQSFQHLECLIYNKMINMGIAIELSKKALSRLPYVTFANPIPNQPSQAELFKKSFLRKVYPKILRLTPETIIPIYEQFEYKKWYQLLIKYSYFRRDGGGGFYHDKSDLDLFLDLHNKAVPEGASPSDYFVRSLLKKHTRPNWHQEIPVDKRRGYFSQQEFLDFLIAMSNSQKTLNRFYGRYALLAYKYYHRKKQNQSLNELSDEAESLLNDISNHYFYVPYPIDRTDFKKRKRDNRHNILHRETKALLEEIEKEPQINTLVKTKTESTKSISKIISEEPRKIDSDSVPKDKPEQLQTEKRFEIDNSLELKQKSPPKIMGKLIFRKIPMDVKKRIGKTVPIAGQIWRTQDWRWGNMSWSGHYGMRKAIKCGDSLDVLWAGGAVLFMKEKGLWEETLIAGYNAEFYFDDVTWDGQYIWVSTRDHGIWLLDTSGKIVTKIDKKDGLPPGNKSLKLAPIEPGKILTVGSFGPHSRVWCAIVEFKQGNASVNVFYKASRVPTKQDNKRKLARDPSLVFQPRWIHEYKGLEKDERIFLVDRYGSGNYLANRFPLKIDINSLSVDVFSFDGENKLSNLIEMDAKPFFSKNGMFFEADTAGVTCYSALGEKLPHKDVKRDFICRDFEYGGEQHNAHTGNLIEYNGYVYVPGSVWFRFDPNTLEEEKLVQSLIPLPYGYKKDSSSFPVKKYGLNKYWVSAHYGLVAWNTNQNFYQILITEKDHDVIRESLKSSAVPGEYFHTFSFEDENGLVTDPDALDSTSFSIEPKGKRRMQYKFKNYKYGGYFPIGTYEAWRGGGGKRNIKSCRFKSIKVTPNSPKHLVFKVSFAEGITYRGQIVHALTGKTIAGAFIATDLSDNLANITPQQWEKMRELPLRPSHDDEALQPLKDISFTSPKCVLRTDANGKFEIKIKLSDSVHSFVAFAENFLSTRMYLSQMKPDEKGFADIPPMLLFPAAKINIEPCILELNDGQPCTEGDNFNLWIKFIYDATNKASTPDDSEKWNIAGFTGTEELYETIDFDDNFGHSHTIKDTNARIFFDMYERYREPKIYIPILKVNRKQAYLVPAGFSFRLKFSAPYQDGKWCMPEIDRTINPKQGETLDLGRHILEPAIKIHIKVINSRGPFKGMPIRQIGAENRNRNPAHVSDENGLTTFFVEPNTKTRFNLYLGDSTRHLQKTITCKIGGKEDEGKKFIMQISDKFRRRTD